MYPKTSETLVLTIVYGNDDRRDLHRECFGPQCREKGDDPDELLPAVCFSFAESREDVMNDNDNNSNDAVQNDVVPTKSPRPRRW